jgi:hypothetical protein
MIAHPTFDQIYKIIHPSVPHDQPLQIEVQYGDNPIFPTRDRNVFGRRTTAPETQIIAIRRG